MIQLTPGAPYKCPSCGRTLVLANTAGQVAGRFVCPRTNRCPLAKKKEVIEL